MSDLDLILKIENILGVEFQQKYLKNFGQPIKTSTTVSITRGIVDNRED